VKPAPRNDHGPGLDARARRLLARFERERGFSREWHQHLVRHDPDFFAQYIGWSSHMYRRGALPLRVKELILMALDAACTHQHGDGTRVHMRNALRHGATVAEVVETLELCTLIGIHSCTLGLPILGELLRESPSGRPPGASGGRAATTRRRRTTAGTNSRRR
jgi:alkylhydroperoxidase/carboxymuconolactone decarboxylase family protein YurZ